jgi:hypothetical protein
MKILIVGNFRTGSWTLLNKLKEEHNLGSMGELFSGFGAQNIDEYIDEKFNTFARGENNVIAKLHPTQLERGFHLNSNEILDICLKFCKFSDKIIYSHRRNTLEQVVSYTVAKRQAVSKAFQNPDKWMAGFKDMSSFDDTRVNYTKEITDIALLNGYRRLLDGHNYIQKIYEKYPREVITMEDVKPFKPYPNQYKYNGSWQPPTNFILGKGEIEPNSNNENT